MTSHGKRKMVRAGYGEREHQQTARASFGAKAPRHHHH
jgi:hypothetical protein